MNVKLKAYIDGLKGVLFNSEQSCCEQITSFISHSLNYAKTFTSMIRLKKDGYVLALLKGLEFLLDKNKSLVEKLNQEFPGQPSSSESYPKVNFKNYLMKLKKKTF